MNKVLVTRCWVLGGFSSMKNLHREPQRSTENHREEESDASLAMTKHYWNFRNDKRQTTNERNEISF